MMFRRKFLSTIACIPAFLGFSWPRNASSSPIVISMDIFEAIIKKPAESLAREGLVDSFVYYETVFHNTNDKCLVLTLIKKGGPLGCTKTSCCVGEGELQSDGPDIVKPRLRAAMEDLVFLWKQNAMEDAGLWNDGEWTDDNEALVAFFNNYKKIENRQIRKIEKCLAS